MQPWEYLNSSKGKKHKVRLCQHCQKRIDVSPYLIEFANEYLIENKEWVFVNVKDMEHAK